MKDPPILSSDLVFRISGDRAKPARRRRLCRWGRWVLLIGVVSAVALTAASFGYNFVTNGPAPRPARLLMAAGGGFDTRYLEWGSSGTPVVLVPGEFETADTFASLGPVLGVHHRVYAIDVTGTGYSAPSPPYDAAHEALQVLAFLSVEGLTGDDAPILVGHSAGAAVAGMAAILGGARYVHGVVFLGGDALPFRGVPEFAGYSIVNPYRTSLLRIALSQSWLIRDLYNSQCGPSCPALTAAGVQTWVLPLEQPGFYGELEYTLRHGIASMTDAQFAELRLVQVPKLVVYGVDDSQMSATDAEQTAERIGAPGPVTVPGEHLTMISSPEQVAAAINSLIALPGRSSAPGTRSGRYYLVGRDSPVPWQIVRKGGDDHAVSGAPAAPRGLGLAALVSIGIGGMVGGGIFSVLGLTVQIAGAAAYLSFVVGGVVAALTGWSYSLLSVRIRSRGGTAVFLDRAFGTNVAGPLNLLLWLSYFVMLGLYAVAFGAYVAALAGLDGSVAWQRVLASAVVACFAGLNLAGAQVVGRAESILVYFKLAVLVAFCIGGLAFVKAARVSPAAYPSPGAIVYAGALIFLGYEGFELIANASEDARDPGRTLPRAYLIAIGGVIALYVLVAFVAVGNLSPHAIATESDYALAAAARPFFGQAGFTLIAVAAAVSTSSAINATLYGAAKFTYLMGRDGELPARFGQPVWNRPIGGLLATTAGTLVIVNTVNIEGISLMGSAGFLIIFGAVNLAAARFASTVPARILPLAGSIACGACLAGLIVYAATHIPAQLAVLGGLIAAAATGEAVIRARGRAAAHSPAAHSPAARDLPRTGRDDDQA